MRFLQIIFLHQFLLFLTTYLLLASNAGSHLFGEEQTYHRASLPPLLEFLNGVPVKSRDLWPARKAEIRRLLTTHFTGSLPDKIPTVADVTTITEVEASNGSRRKRIKITLDTPRQASFEIALWTPRGDGPFPLLMMAPRYYQIYWAEDAVQRGYAVCLYPGVDSHHRESKFPNYEDVWQTFRQEYPQATWTEIVTKAWLASRSLDVLLNTTHEFNIDAKRIGIIGFSRYGKQALIATALDERIRCVVARSPGSPGSCPYRYTGRDTFAEAPSDFPSLWFLPSLRSYTGREDELPIDAHGWYALIAPRPCLIHTAHNDGSEPTFAVEQAYREGQKVYQLLGHSDRLRIDYRSGGHSSGPDPEKISPADRQRNLDWFDLSFQRGDAKQSDFPESWIHRFDWQTWREKQTPDALEPPDQASTRQIIQWSLGTPAVDDSADEKRTFLTSEESELMTHDRWAIDGVTRVPVSFGKNVRGNLYFKDSLDHPAPVVIWLHPFSYHSGYNEGYGVQGTTVYHRLAAAGYVVLAYDQCGFGLRLLEGRDFYETHPAWSRLGRMVQDVHAAVDYFVDGRGKANGPIPAIDKQKITLLGYSVGGMTALYAAALDQRIHSVASFSGFTPLRADTDDGPTGGIRRWWELHALQPKLGLFDDRESKIPYDFDNLLEMIAPRPVLLVSPQHDRSANLEAINACVAEVKTAWPSTSKSQTLIHSTPDGTNRFQRDQHQLFLEWRQGL